MDIKVVGIACPKTERTFLNAQVAAGEWGFSDNVQLISDAREMAAEGISHTPTVLVNGKEKSSGRIPSLYEIRMWISQEVGEGIAA